VSPTFPFRIWRFIFAELWRLLILSAGVLVTVVAFAATVRPLADGRLGPIDALWFMAMAALPMLQYALPFAASFSATLAYHRMAQDNEIQAAHASGVSHRSLLVPALVSGLLLAVVLSVLSEEVMPRFLRSMDELLTANAARLVVSSIQRGEPIQRERMMIYADQVRIDKPDPGSTARDKMTLKGIAVVQTDADGKVVSDATARLAQSLLYPGRARGAAPAPGGDASTVMVINAQDFVASDPGGQITFARGDQQQFKLQLPGGFEDDPKFLTFGELRAARRHPERMNYVDAKRRDLALRIAERQTVELAGRQLLDSHRLVLTDDQGQQIILGAAELREDAEGRFVLAPVGGRPIELRILRNGPDGTRGAGGPSDAFTAGSGWLRTSIDESSRDVTVTLGLLEVAPGRASRTLAHLTPVASPTAELLAATPADLLQRAKTLPGDKPVQAAAGELRTTLRDLDKEITSNQHQRIAMSLACMVMVVGGALTAMRLPTGMPLAVYLWSFFPALGAVIAITTGHRIVLKMNESGLIMLWAAVVALAAYAVWAFRVVRRH
jgi:lipopolysaccharide export LptBFGC system permease protein LptF